MNPRLGALLWWSLRRAVRAYGILHAAALPVGMALAWLLLSRVVSSPVRPWHLALALPVVAGALAAWRVISDRSSGFADGLACSAGASRRASAACTVGAYGFLCVLQMVLMSVLVRVANP